MTELPDKPHRSLTRSLWVMVAGSFAFGFALVPLYNVICEAAGIRVNATPSPLQASDAGAGRQVTLEFMSMLPPGSEFELIPETRTHEAAAGQALRGEVPHPQQGRPCRSSAQAVPSIAPSTTAKYLQKTECFCFTPQSVRGGRTARIHGALHRRSRPAAGRSTG